MITKREVCALVAQRLMDKGWCRRNYGLESGPNCALGALARVLNTSTSSQTFFDAGGWRILQLAGIDTWWNDTVAINRVDVVSKLQYFAETGKLRPPRSRRERQARPPWE